MEQSEIIKPRY